MATPPDFSAGAVLTAAQMNQVAAWRTIPTVSGTGAAVSSSGLVTITAGTTTGCYINNCFTDDYRTYRVIISQAKGSTTSYIYLRLSVGGSANSTASSYSRASTLATTTAINASGETNNLFYIGPTTTTNGLNCTIDVFNPKIAVQTGYNIASSHANGDTVVGGGRHNQATAYDGLFLASNAGTFDCFVEIYGFNS